jgi:23S rRNA pseudouridine1911/1915/1917 synthase
MSLPDTFHFVVDSSQVGIRLDVFISSRLTDLSRSHIAHLIQEEQVTVNTFVKKPGYRIRAGDRISGIIPAAEMVPLEPQPLELDIIHEDEDLVVVNKQPGLVVHPAPGHDSGTLVNALLYHFPDIGPIGGELRPGIVHRLDKDTSGIIIVAKNSASLAHLTAQFSARTIRKTYLALVYGQMKTDSGRIDLPIGRHSIHRKKMSAGSPRSRAAETTWKTRKSFTGLSLLELNLKTGRTHQARVHCAAIGHPVVGDPVYGKRRPDRELPCPVADIVGKADRQMLHAWKLTFTHPATDDSLSFTAPLAGDMLGLIEKLGSVNAFEANSCQED